MGKTSRHFDTSGSLGVRDIAMGVFCGSAGGICILVVGYCQVRYLASRYIDDIPSPSSTRLHFMTASHENTTVYGSLGTGVFKGSLDTSEQKN